MFCEHYSSRSLLLAVASVTCAYQHCRPRDGETDYQQFLRQHYDNPKTSGKDYCDKMMHLRCMTNQDRPNPKCKERNSFSHATAKQIQAICGNAGKPYKDDLRVSNLPFRVTTCTCQGDPDVHPCKYRDSAATRRIVIRCAAGLPVHFADGIVVPN